jgi:hypothetical protein
LRDTWLNIPQAVVLESTGNLQLARDLDDDDPDRLVIKAILRLPPLISLDIDAFPNIEAARQQWRALVGSQVEESAYEKGLRRVHAKLLEGVTTKGSRAPNRPLEVIDPAEFARLELRRSDAVDTRTGEPVWYSLVISARGLLEGNSETAGEAGDSEVVERAHTPLVWAREETAPVSDRELRSWYEHRVQELLVWGKPASGEADWKAAKRRFADRVTRIRVRALREKLAPETWKKQGRQSAPATE